MIETRDLTKMYGDLYALNRLTIKLEKGDVLVMFSDGVTEAPNPNDEEYGEERLANLVAELSARPAREIVNAIHKSVHDYAEGAPPADDITVVVCRMI